MKPKMNKQVNFLMGGFIAGLFLMPFPVVWSHYNNHHVSHYTLGCPSSVKEGDSAKITITRAAATSTVGNKSDIHFKGWDATIQTQTDTADSNDYTHIDEKKWVEYARVNFPMEFVIQTTDDDTMEEDEQFTVNVKEVRIKQKQNRDWPASDITHRHPIDPESSDDTSCSITIRNDDVGITDVSVVSTPADGDTYYHGETILIDITFNEKVLVSRSPHVTFWLKGKWRGAGYQSGSRTKTLRFSYRVGQKSQDLQMVADKGIEIGSAGKVIEGGGSLIVLRTGSYDVKKTFSRSKMNNPGHRVSGVLNCDGERCTRQHCIDAWNSSPAVSNSSCGYSSISLDDDNPLDTKCDIQVTGCLSGSISTPIDDVDDLTYCDLGNGRQVVAVDTSDCTNI